MNQKYLRSVLLGALGLVSLQAYANNISGDFNGDGFADLAVGAPGENNDAGAVNVIYGSATGLLPAGGPGVPVSQFWGQSSSGISGESEKGDNFGAALAAGDFNADGFADLAIGVPGELWAGFGVPSYGRVVVIYGSSFGLTTNNAIGVPAAHDLMLRNVSQSQWGEFKFGVDLAVGTEADFDTSVENWKFGASLITGDFNGDGVADLAVGAPGSPALGDNCYEIVHIPGTVYDKVDGSCNRAGGVAVYFGARGARITLAGSRFLSLHTLGLGNIVQPNTYFGHALAAVDIDRDGRSDLIISAPNQKNVNNETAGAVYIISGGNLTRPRFTLAGDGGRFGSALATGDFDGDGDSDLAVGAPSLSSDRYGIDNAGAVHVFNNQSGTLSSASSQLLDQAHIGTIEPQDAFGHSLAAGDFNADGRDDLAIGVPGEGVVVDGLERRMAGEVDIVYGSSSGLSITAHVPQVLHQSVPNIGGGAEAGDAFGFSLTVGNFGKNEIRYYGNLTTGTLPVFVNTADLAIGVPSEDVGSITNAGAVNVIYGRGLFGNGLSAEGNQIFTQGDPGVPGASESGDLFGAGL